MRPIKAMKMSHANFAQSPKSYHVLNVRKSDVLQSVRGEHVVRDFSVPGQPREPRSTHQITPSLLLFVTPGGEYNLLRTLRVSFSPLTREVICRKPCSITKNSEYKCPAASLIPIISCQPWTEEWVAGSIVNKLALFTTDPKCILSHVSFPMASHVYHLMESFL